MTERPNSKTISLYVGVDVSKDFLDFDLPSNEAIRIENAIEPIDTICALLKKKKMVMVVMEATGGYEHLLRTRLAKHCIFAAVVNPRQVRDFAKGIGIDAKTDPMDSKVISTFGIVVKPLPTAMKSNEDERRSALVTRRSQLLELITQEKNRLKQAAVALKPRIERAIRTRRISLCSCCSKRALPWIIQPSQKLAIIY